MNTYKVIVGRRIYEDIIIEVEAESLDQATEKAQAEAINTDVSEWNVYDCEYEIHSVEILPVEEESHD
jgi:hypothetical protein